MKSLLSDPEKKKVAWRDMRFSEFGETAHMANPHRNPLRRNNRNLIIVTNDTDQDVFMREMCIDWEQEILPSLEKLESMKAWIAFFENSSWLSGPRAAAYFREKSASN